MTEEEQKVLKEWVRSGTSEQRMEKRARIILEDTSGKRILMGVEEK